MNDEDLNPYSGKLVSTSPDVTDLLSNTFVTTTTTPNGSGYAITSTPGNSNLNINTGYSHISAPNVEQTAPKIDQTKEQQLEDVKDILNSVQRALDGLKTQVQVLSASIEDENELKHKRRKLGGNE